MQSKETIVDCYKQEFIDRLRFLRNEQHISAREMSIVLGQNVNYINLIENGKRLPSMQGFFLICECLQITPSQFFAKTEGKNDSVPEVLSQEQKECIAALIHAFNGKK